MKRRKALTGLSSPPLKNPPNAFGTGAPPDGKRSEHADPPHALRLLRTSHERQRSSRAAQQQYELAPLHSITSSARARTVAGMSRQAVGRSGRSQVHSF